MNEANPDLIVYGSYKGRKITAVREWRNTAYPEVECIADFEDFDLGDLRGNGRTPQDALDDLLEKCEVRDDV
jgi:hypothetical protein